MNPFAACGFWPSRTSLAASVVDTEGRLHRTALPNIDELHCWNFLADFEGQHGLDVQIVLPDALRGHALAAMARERQMTVLVAPGLLAEAIAAVAYARAGPGRLATVLARLPGSRFRTHLRLLPRCDPRQLLLL